jgi:hypothetical protein
LALKLIRIRTNILDNENVPFSTTSKHCYDLTILCTPFSLHRVILKDVLCYCIDVGYNTFLNDHVHMYKYFIFQSYGTTAAYGAYDQSYATSATSTAQTYGSTPSSYGTQPSAYTGTEGLYNNLEK